ncbi:acylhydrolase [Candidatus Falkowbacteria bacterium CG10_big_fil_rev_8_21_14_0_10_37_14]|uniref:Acylhydrolase n=1 Tax=Candidatus Falkowbacteria bacterium CG10_big_fil_rev_8_21_14_0_10_37_14 TaxID=1974561 RepID=A0A2M6WT07_9BACT|nr:MAG: acylhydrolase [Candidatus Falkowbacteria bacterium CG10_big_fil_rev_8_21_14_0_10_37_14]
MNTLPSALRIMCYGDSNTWGYIPVKGTRYPFDKRWTGIFQNIIGIKYEVIEEGLNGRTTDLDDPSHEGMNGLSCLAPCLKSHFPIDYLIIMLGSNDLKNRFYRDAKSIAIGIRRIVQKVRDLCIAEGQSLPKIILINPPTVDEQMCNLAETFKGALKKSKMLPELYANISVKEKCILIDLQKFVKTSKHDGFHLDEKGHATIGKMVSSVILNN